MKKTLGIIFNIFWIIFVGIQSAILSALTGAACCLTLVGIPFGIQHFKFIPLAFAPAGKVVVIRPNKRPVLNFLWMIFGGFTSMLYFSLLGLVLTCTVVGYPVAVQLFKIANFCAAPFGAEIVIEGKYSSTKDTNYDQSVVATRILENPDKTIDTPTGITTSTRNYLLSFRDARFIENEKKFKLTRLVYIASAILMPIVAIVYVILAATGPTEALYNMIFPEAEQAHNMLASYLALVLKPFSTSALLAILFPFTLVLLGEAGMLGKFMTARNALYGKILSPGNIQWLINCYPDNTDVKSFFYSSPEKMLRKLNVALSRGASRTPVVIDELNYSVQDDDNVDDVLCIANNEPEDNFTVTAEPKAEEIVANEVIAEAPEAVAANEITAEVVTEEPAAEPEAEIEIVEEPATEPEVETEIVEEPAAEPEVETEIVEEPAAEPEVEIEIVEEPAAEDTDPATEKTEADETANV